MNIWKFKAIRYFLLVMVFTILLVTCSDGFGAETNSTTVPPIPTNVSAEALSSTSIRITWSHISNAANYDVYFETNSSALSKLTNVTTNSYIHSYLQLGTDYKYYITAINKAGASDFSSPASAITLVEKPAKPTGVTNAKLSSGKIRITWNPVTDATSYDVYYTSGYSYYPKGFAANVTSPPYIYNTSYVRMLFFFIKAKTAPEKVSFLITQHPKKVTLG